MKKIVLLLFALFVFFDSHAQVIDNKFNVYFEYNSGGFIGSEMIDEDNFIYPSLYANYKNLNGYATKGLVKIGSICSIGLEGDYFKASNWELYGYEDYTNSTTIQYSFSPKVQIHTPFKETGLFNRIRAIIEIGPVAGISELNLANPLFDVEMEDISFPSAMKTTDQYYGIKGSAGLELNISNSLGLYATYTRQYYRIGSKFYQDKNSSSYWFDLGIFLRLNKNKRLFY
jgi:hypothetical protein